MYVVLHQTSDKQTTNQMLIKVIFRYNFFTGDMVWASF